MCVQFRDFHCLRKRNVRTNKVYDAEYKPKTCFIIYARFFTFIDNVNICETYEECRQADWKWYKWHQIQLLMIAVSWSRDRTYNFVTRVHSNTMRHWNMCNALLLYFLLKFCSELSVLCDKKSTFIDIVDITDISTCIKAVLLSMSSDESNNNISSPKCHLT